MINEIAAWNALAREKESYSFRIKAKFAGKKHTGKY
jgi:hypothetical protein